MKERINAVGSEEEWTEWFDGLSDSDKQMWARQMENAPTVGPNSGPQTEAYLSKADVVGFGGAAGGGKCLVNQQLTQTPLGEVEIGKLRIGDIICDVFGKTQKVIRVWRHPNHDVYKVKFSDRTSVLCGAEHIWLAWYQHAQYKNSDGTISYGPQAASLWRTDGIMEGIKKGRKYSIPICEPVFTCGRIPEIDGYCLGAFLGDGTMPKPVGGGLSQARIGVHKKDIEIIEYMMSKLSIQLKPVKDKSSPQMSKWSLAADATEIKWMKDHGLFGTVGHNKFIPKECFIAPIEWRWELLRGLCDTDGCANDSRRRTDYVTTSKQLMDDVCQLARGLGCIASYVKYENKGHPTWRCRYNISIRCLNPIELFNLKRKKDIAKTFNHKVISKRIKSIEYIGKRDCTCIQVDCPTGLYLTDDYTVTHNSALISLLALQNHQRTVIFRADGKQMRGLVDDLVQFSGSDHGLNRNAGVFRFGDRVGHQIEWGGIGEPGSELSWRGRAHDLICIDEATEVSEKKFRWLMTWNRTVVRGQRVRALLTFNPPGGPDDIGGSGGRWVIDYFAPWLDERHPNPANVGELRYFHTDSDGKEVETTTNESFVMKLGGKDWVVKPQSRTFISSRVQNNPYLMGTNYEQQLLSLEEPLRSQMLLGDFRSGVMDSEWQVIPTRWVDDAMDRWTPAGRCQEMSALGVDVARGGRDSTCIAARHGWWWDKLKLHAGKDTPDGPEVASLVVKYIRDSCQVNIDSLGVGASPFDFLKKMGVNVKGVVSNRQKIVELPRLETNQVPYNLRSALWWLLRKVLDPANGLEPQLPKDNRLRSELIAVHHRVINGKWAVEAKVDLKARLHYSPDSADAIAYSLLNAFDTDGSERLNSKKSKVDYSKLYQSGKQSRTASHGTANQGSSNWMSS